MEVKYLNVNNRIMILLFEKRLKKIIQNLPRRTNEESLYRACKHLTLIGRMNLALEKIINRRKQNEGSLS